MNYLNLVYAVILWILENLPHSAKSLIEQLKKYGGLKLNSCKMNKIVDEFFYIYGHQGCVEWITLSWDFQKEGRLSFS